MKKIWSTAWRIFVVLLVVVATQFLKFSLIEALIALYFASAILWRIESERTFLVALLLLMATAVLSFLRNDALAEEYAVYAYYFLVIGVITAIIELIGQPRPKPKQPRAGG